MTLEIGGVKITSIRIIITVILIGTMNLDKT